MLKLKQIKFKKNMGAHKITYYPTQKIEDIDKGMMTLINRGMFQPLYLRKRQKSIQRLDEKTLPVIEKIFEFREKKVKEKILNHIQKNAVFIISTNQTLLQRINYSKNIEHIITKEIICIYVVGMKFCPGLYEITEKRKSII